MLYDTDSFQHYHRGLAVTVAPASEPVTATEVKLQTKVGFSTEDDLITIYIKAARELVEKHLGIALLPQTVQEKYSAFPQATRLNPHRAIMLKRYPLRSISSIAYKDADGQTVFASDYVVDATAQPPILAPAYEQDWPDTYKELGAVTITYTAGFDNAASVPADIKQAILLIVADWFDNRENAVRERMTAADAILLNRRGYVF